MGISGDGNLNRVWVSHPLVIARHTVPWQSSRQAQSSLDSVTKLFELFCNFACFCPRLCVIEPRFCFFSSFFNEHIISALCRSVNNFFCFFENFNFYTKFFPAPFSYSHTSFCTRAPTRTLVLFMDILRLYIVYIICPQADFRFSAPEFSSDAPVPDTIFAPIFIRFLLDFMQKNIKNA